MVSGVSVQVSAFWPHWPEAKAIIPTCSSMPPARGKDLTPDTRNQTPLLISQILTNQLDMDAVLDHVAFDDAPHVANPLGRSAITAQPCFNTGIF